MQVLNIFGDGQNCQNQTFKWLYQLNESKYEKSFFELLHTCVCVGGVPLHASIHPIFFPTCALLLSYHRNSLLSHHSFTPDRPTDRCFDKISDSPFTKRSTDQPTDRRDTFLDIDSWTKSTANRPTDRLTVSPVVSWLDGWSVGRSVGASVYQD